MKLDVKDYIRTVPDYPIKGVNFYDMNSLFASEIWGSCVEQLARDMDWGSKYGHVTHIVGIESRGFVLGAALAHEMQKPFVMVRKAGAKYPGTLMEQSYDLEYGSATLTLQTGLLGHTSRVLIADDLVATGGSMLATKKLVEQTGAKAVGGVAVVNLKYINDRDLESFDIISSYDAQK